MHLVRRSMAASAIEIVHGRMEARFGGILGLCVGYSMICQKDKYHSVLFNSRKSELHPKHVVYAHHWLDLPESRGGIRRVVLGEGLNVRLH